MDCLFCNMPETQFNFSKAEGLEVQHSHDAKGFVCSSCTQMLLSTPQEKLKEAYQLATDKGMVSKAKAISMFIEEEEIVRRAKKPKRDTLGRETLRMVRPTLNKIGA